MNTFKFKCTYIILIVFLVIANISYAETKSYKAQNAFLPTVYAVEVQKPGLASSHRMAETPVKPHHPPIDKILPIPMPEETYHAIESAPPGKGIIHNIHSKETIAISGEQDLATIGTMEGGGFNGIYGGDGTEEMTASFGGMQKVTAVEDFPWRMNAKLILRFGNQWFVCSGTMRDAETVLTAGHCVYDYGGSGWADEIYVYPGYDGTDPTVPTVGAYGWGYANYLGAWTSWIQAGDLNYDIGVIGIDRAVGMLTGWYGWACDGSCALRLGQMFMNPSYPAEHCGLPGIHNGLDMYSWSGYFYSCPTWNRIRLDTTPGCFSTVWGGMSGSGAYYINNDERYVHGVCSTSDRAYWADYTRQSCDWVNWCENTFITDVRGSVFDIQPLDVNVQPSTIAAGDSISLINHIAANATNGSANGTWKYSVYLSSNDTISTSDILLSSQSYNWNFSPMSSVKVDMASVTIPLNTPEGNYWIGILYDAVTDSNPDNNFTYGWDSVPIRILPPCQPPSVPGLQIPPNGATGVSASPMLIWNDVAGATSYEVQVCSDAACSSIARTSSTVISEWTIQPALSQGTQYWWRVRANNSCGNGTWSSVWSFTTASEGLAHIDLGSACSGNGSTITIPVTLTNVAGTDIATLCFDIAYDDDVLEYPSCEVGPAGSAASKNCALGTPSASVVSICISGSNNNVIGDGIIANMTFTIKPTASEGCTNLYILNILAANPVGNPVAATGANGCGCVSSKAGDCDGEGTVSIAEVQKAINHYLGITGAYCSDLDGSGACTIDEVQQVINCYLGVASCTGGCGTCPQVTT